MDSGVKIKKGNSITVYYIVCVGCIVNTYYDQRVHVTHTDISTQTDVHNVLNWPICLVGLENRLFVSILILHLAYDSCMRTV